MDFYFIKWLLALSYYQAGCAECAVWKGQKLPVLPYKAEVCEQSSKQTNWIQHLFLVKKNNIQLLNHLITQTQLLLFAFVGQKAVQSCDHVTNLFLSYRNVFVIYCDDPQAVPTSNGTSFDFVTTENGPVCLDLYSTPQYKMDQPSDCAGEPFTLCGTSL